MLIIKYHATTTIYFTTQYFKSFFTFLLDIMVYDLQYVLFMPFCFYKSYQRIIGQQLYINIKYIPMKTQQHNLNTFQ